MQILRAEISPQKRAGDFFRRIVGFLIYATYHVGSIPEGEKMIISDISIAKKIVACFLILIFINILGGFINYNKLTFIDKTTGWSEHTYDVLNVNDHLISSMVDRETGVRGYLVAGDRTFLAPYEAGANAFGVAAGRLRALTADNPASSTVSGKSKPWPNGCSPRSPSLRSP